MQRGRQVRNIQTLPILAIEVDCKRKKSDHRRCARHNGRVREDPGRQQPCWGSLFCTNLTQPTTALDVTIQAQVLELMRKLKAKYQTSMIMITHDLGIVAEICDYVAVMYAGEIVEYGNREQLFHRPSHPYTKGLFACIPNLMEEETTLIPIEGMTPDPTNLPTGCRFHPRCPYATEECSKTNPASKEIENGHHVKCLHI